MTRLVAGVTTSSRSILLLAQLGKYSGRNSAVRVYTDKIGSYSEWVEDPYSEYGYVYTGPGFRLPFYIISPWTRGGNVYVEHADHSSQIKFIEQVYAAKGKNIVTSQIPAWRRTNMADLTTAFHFEHPDYSIPSMPNASYPSTDKKGNWNGYAVCEATYRLKRPPVPYGKQSQATSLVTEDGSKAVRGQLTEGRYLVFEMNGYALASSSGTLTATKATSSHNTKSQRFVISGSASKFTLRDGNGKAMSSSANYTIVDMGNGEGYSVKNPTGQYIAINKQGKVMMEKTAKGFATFSVTYSD
jgi:phospholipase C